MAKALPDKERKGIVAGQNHSTDNSSIADGVANFTRVQTPAISTFSAGNGSEKHPSTEESSASSIPVSDSLEKSTKPSGKGLLPVKHKQAVGTSYSQPATSPGLILLEGGRQDKLHEIQIFSSQKMPQPFLDK